MERHKPTLYIHTNVCFHVTWLNITAGSLEGYPAASSTTPSFTISPRAMASLTGRVRVSVCVVQPYTMYLLVVLG